MSRRRTAMLLTAMIVAASGAAALTSPQPAQDVAANHEYRLQQGDTLQVRLYYNPDLNEQLPIRPDGKISLSLIGDIQAAGLTPGELSRQLTAKYAAVLRQPDTVVIVKDFFAQRVFIGGQVNQPGTLRIAGPTTVLQAVVEAGGFKAGARADTVVLLRNPTSPHPEFRTVNLKHRLSKSSSEADLLVQPGDVIFVPKTKVTKFAEFMSQVRDFSPVPLNFGLTYIIGNALLR